LQNWSCRAYIGFFSIRVIRGSSEAVPSYEGENIRIKYRNDLEPEVEFELGRIPSYGCIGV